MLNINMDKVIQHYLVYSHGPLWEMKKNSNF